MCLKRKSDGYTIFPPIRYFINPSKYSVYFFNQKKPPKKRRKLDFRALYIEYGRVYTYEEVINEKI